MAGRPPSIVPGLLAAALAVAATGAPRARSADELHGRVVEDGSGAAVAGIAIVLTGAESDGELTVRTDEGGRFRAPSHQGLRFARMDPTEHWRASTSRVRLTQRMLDGDEEVLFRARRVEGELFSGVLIDASTGSSIPWYRLTFYEAGETVETVLTDEHGHFRTTTPLVRADTEVRFTETSRTERVNLDSFLIGEPGQEVRLLTEVGPTIRFELLDWTPGPRDRLNARLYARGQGATASERPWVLGRETWPVRGETVPFVRFPARDHAEAREELPGPYRVVLQSNDGLYEGSADLAALEAAPDSRVRVTIEPRSVVDLTITTPGGTPADDLEPELVRVGSPEAPRRPMANHSDPARGTWRFGWLEPGTYVARARTRRLGIGDAEIVVGAGDRVAIERVAQPPDGTADVRGVLRGAGGALLEGAELISLSTGASRRVELTPVEGESGSHRFAFPAAPPDAYWLELPRAGNLRWSPRERIVRPGPDELAFELEVDAPLAHFDVELVDARTGEPLDDALFAWRRADQPYAAFERAYPSPGVPLLREVPADEAFTWRVGRRGYRSRTGTEADFAPDAEAAARGLDLRRARIELEPGLGETIRVLAWDPDAAARDLGPEFGWLSPALRAPRNLDRIAWARPLEGVRIVADGALLGTTDADGRAWVERDEAPARIEFELPGWRPVRHTVHTPHRRLAEPAPAWLVFLEPVP